MTDDQRGDHISSGRRIYVAPSPLTARAPRLAVICLVLLLALPTGIVAVAQGLGAIALLFNLYVVDQRLPGIFKLHMLASGAALLLTPRSSPCAVTAPGTAAGLRTAVAVSLGALTSPPVALYSHSVVMARAGSCAGRCRPRLIALGILATAGAASPTTPG